MYTENAFSQNKGKHYNLFYVGVIKYFECNIGDLNTLL